MFAPCGHGEVAEWLKVPHSKFAYPRIVLYRPISRSTELLAQFDAAVSLRLT